MNAVMHPTIALLQSSSLTMWCSRKSSAPSCVGEYAPGQQADRSHPGRKAWACRAGPVREAFRMLEEAGLVRTEKNRGVFVRDIPIDEAVEIFDLRAAMDELVGRQLARTSRRRSSRKSRGLVDAMEKAVKADDTRQLPPAEPQFHDRLVEMAGNRKLTAIYRKLIKELSLFRRLNLADGWLMPISARRAPGDVKAIASATRCAGRAMFDHVMESKDRTIDERPAPPGPPGQAPPNHKTGKTDNHADKLTEEPTSCPPHPPWWSAWTAASPTTWPRPWPPARCPGSSRRWRRAPAWWPTAWCPASPTPTTCRS
jgi:DNA-binding GntR family transcriptional regulator